MTSAHSHLLLVVVLCACAGPKPASPAADVEIFTDNPKVEDLTLGDITIALPYEIENKGAAPVSLDAIEWTLLIPGEVEARGSVSPDKTVSAGQSTSGALTAKGTLDTSEGAYTRRLTGDNTARYHAEAIFKVAGSEYQASWSGELLLPRRPSVEASTQATRNDKSVEAHFILTIENPNPFALPVERLDYVISVEGAELLRGTLGTNTKVPQGSELQFDVTGTVQTKDAATKSLRYNVDTTLVAAGQTFSAPLEGSIEFAR